MIFYGLDPEQSVIIVQSGIAVVINYLANGEPMIIGIVGRGVMIGEMEALFQVQYPYVIKALTPVVVCKHYSIHLVRLVKENPAYLHQVVAAIENNDHSLGRQLWVMNAQRVQERLRRQLTILANTQVFGGEETTLRLTHNDLALLVNTDRATVSRTLKKLEKEGFVRSAYHSITVLGDISIDENALNFRILPVGKNRSML